MKKKYVLTIILLIIISGIAFLFYNKKNTVKVPFPNASFILSESNPQNSNNKLSFSARTTSLKFKVSLGQKVAKKFSFVPRALAQSGSKNEWTDGTTEVKTEVMHEEGRIESSIEAEISQENDETLSFTLNRKESTPFTPGDYALQVTFKQGSNTRTIQQNFTWGVLALNTDKSIYMQGETAYLQMGVLDERGHTICKAQADLEITTPSGIKTQLSTNDNTIQYGKECAGDTYVTVPDYFGYYDVPKETGIYKMRLTATTPNGQNSIDDEFEVRQNVEFDIQRSGPTRIWPKADYDMQFKITPKDDFKGEISEKVPKGFGISKTTKSDLQYSSVKEVEDAKIITWNVDFEKDKEYILSYKINFPDVSPEFYLLGPLRIVNSQSSIANSFSETRRWQIASDEIATATVTVVPNGDSTVQFANCTAGSDGNCGTGHYTTVDDGTTPSTSGYVSTGTAADTGGQIEDYNMTTSTLSNLVSVSSFQVSIHAQIGTQASTADTLDISAFLGGSFQTNQTINPTTSWASYTATFTGSYTQSDLDNLRVRITRNSLGTGPASGRDDDVQVANVYVTVTYSYLMDPEKITQDGYIFENDDEDLVTGDAVDENTQQAGTSFTSGKTLTSVKKGERITARMHLKNTGTGALASNLGLFYDRNDGIWSKVESNATPSAATGNCTDTNWDCSTIISSNVVGQYTSIAFDPSGRPWISYYEGTGGSCNDSPTTECSLGVAIYVGSGGTGCASTAWTCTIVDNPTTTSDLGSYTSMAFDNIGNAWISYYDVTNSALKVASYSAGMTASGTCSADWVCETVDNTGTNTGQYTSIAIDVNNKPWVSYYDTTNTSLRVATRGGGFGSACTSSNWTCAVVDNSGTDKGSYTSIAFDPSGNAWVSYYDATGTQLEVANYVGSGGTCTDTAWTCEDVDNTGTNTGTTTSIAFDPTGTAWVSYYDTTNSSLRVATRGTSIWNPSGTCTDTDWECDVVVSSLTGASTSIAFDSSGKPWVSTQSDDGFSCMGGCNLFVSRYVGSGGSGCTSSAWTCTESVDTSGGLDSSLAFDPNGNVWVSHFDAVNLDLRVAKIKRGGEILISPSAAGVNNDPINESHADMTSATDTSNRDDADCITGAAQWRNGLNFESEEATGSALPAGDGTAQCTEIAFTIDTSQAVAGTTYRLVVATKDNWRSDKGVWRGPISVSTDSYPTLTVEANTTTRFYKDAMPKFANCTDTSWGCMDVEAAGSNQLVMAFSPEGIPWISYNNGGISVAYKTSGSGCNSSAWTCTTIDTGTSGGYTGYYSSIAFDPAGKPWIAYNVEDISVNGCSTDDCDLKVAQYVGNGGAGCSSTSAWTCTNIDTTRDVGLNVSLAIDPAGNPWISYQDRTNKDLYIARYVGSGGSGCNSSAWTCTLINTTSDVGYGNSIAFDSHGKPWISYTNNATFELGVARYVGSGGTGCSSTSAWTCTIVDTVNAPLNYTSVAFDPSGSAWIAYHDNSGNFELLVTHFVGDGSGTGCSSSDWTGCSFVDNTDANNVGATTLAFDSSGNPWISYVTNLASPNLRVARYVGSGGSGCGVSSWTCTTVDSPNSVGGISSSIAFDPFGNAWVAYYDSTNFNIRVAKTHLPVSRPQANNQYPYLSRSWQKGTGRYLFSSGKAPATESGTCSGVSDLLGYCGVATDDSYFDKITALTTERPIGVYAVRFSSNATAPTATWTGRSNLAPSTASTPGDIIMEVYRFGSTNAWESLDSETASSDCNTADCTVSATPAGTASEYFEADGSNYWAYFRLYQIEDGSTTITLKTDYFNAAVVSGPGIQINGGLNIRGGTKIN